MHLSFRTTMAQSAGNVGRYHSRNGSILSNTYLGARRPKQILPSPCRRVLPLVADNLELALDGGLDAPQLVGDFLVGVALKPPQGDLAKLRILEQTKEPG